MYVILTEVKVSHHHHHKSYMLLLNLFFFKDSFSSYYNLNTTISSYFLLTSFNLHEANRRKHMLFMSIKMTNTTFMYIREYFE